MPDSKELANQARTTLSEALEALQTGEDLPEKLLEIAAPIAKTMGVLHRVERQGGGSASEVEASVEAIRGVLDDLQNVGGNHPAVDATMEAVASALGKMFALSKALKAAAASEPQPKPKTVSETKVGIEAKPAVAAAPREAAPEARSRKVEAAEPIADKPIADKPIADKPIADKPAADKPAAKAKPPAHAAPGASTAEGKARIYDVELGAHSVSNFFKGLSGNDVIDHGGLFVATYQLPKVGQALVLRVHLPGDLEFEADAVVQWIRDVRSDESEPGFGARFSRIAPEGRQLVYRYVRNREPMFYDDL